MTFKRAGLRYGETPEPVTPYQKAAQVWDERIGSARVQAHNWRLMALGSPRAVAHPGGDPAVAGTLGLDDALHRRGRSPWWGPRRRARGRGLQAKRRADRLPSRALRRQRALAVDRSGRRPPELAQGLRLRHRPRRGHAQRVRPRQRPLRQGRPRDRRRRGHQRGARLGLARSRCAGWSAASRAAPSRTPSGSPASSPSSSRRRGPWRRCARTHSASTCTPSTGRRTSTGESRNEHTPQTRMPLVRWCWPSAPAPPGCRCRRSRSSTAPRFKAAKREPEPKRAVEYVEVPKPLPLPGQLKPVPKKTGEDR